VGNGNENEGARTPGVCVNSSLICADFAPDRHDTPQDEEPGGDRAGGLGRPALARHLRTVASACRPQRTAEAVS